MSERSYLSKTGRQRLTPLHIGRGAAILLAIALVLVASAALTRTRENPREPVLSDREVIDRFTEIFLRPQGGAIFENEWFGIPTLQNPNDIWITQEILFETKPDVIVEAGTHQGGSAVLYAMLFEFLNPDGRVITIDIADKTKKARELPIFQKRVDFLHGSSTSPKIIADVKKRVAGKKAMVILDSAHGRDHVLAELRAYSELVPVGGYVLVQDSVVNGHPAWDSFGPGPFEAIEAFLKENDAFEIDKSRERLLLTLHPSGYLRRVK